MRKLTFLMAIVFPLAMFLPAAADDFAPPDYRGQPLSVWAAWEFKYPNEIPDPMPPDGFNTVGNQELLHPQSPLAKIFNFDNMMYDPDLGGWTGGPEDGFLDINLPNFIDMEPHKYVRVQMTFIDPLEMTTPTVNLIEAFDLAEFPGISYQGYFSDSNLIDPNHVYEDWIIEPNPDWEIIQLKIPNMVTLTEVVIDTVSVPEPVAGSWLVILACLAMGRMRRP